jgi:2-polyprenyl-3-methyl-5-hydroxy-6-metoxy-1,4-benzoquinol methylase
MKTYSSRPSVHEQTVPVDCNFCGGRDLVFHYHTDGVDYSRCKRCGLIFQNPMPSEDDLRKRYDSKYYDYEIENEKKFFGLMKLALGDVRFFELTEALPPGKQFLDIGCATGMLLEYLTETGGWEARGVEVCEAAVRYGREKRGLRIFHGTLAEASFPAASFDVVHASHVIEHVTDPSAFFHEIYRIVKPGGRFVVTTPNASGLQSRLFGNTWRSAIADHMYLFTKKTLAGYLSLAGFTVFRKKTWGGIAKGLAGPGVKKMIDTFAKISGCGDVMVFLGEKKAGR